MTENWGVKPIPERVTQRAATRWVLEGECWVSTYSTASHGYAQIGWSGVEGHGGTTAHRASWTHFNGPIPVGMALDHSCNNRRCVRPDHLELMSNLKNARRTRGRDWPEGQCVNGHPDDLYWHHGPTQGYCMACKNELQRRRRGTVSPRKQYKKVF